MTEVKFDVEYVLEELRHYLPSQTPLKDFIHHNSLHAFQDLKFYDAIFKASEVFGYKVTLELNDFRKLFAAGRIKNEILEKIICEAKDKNNLVDWKDKLLTKHYDEYVIPRIGKLRCKWKQNLKIDLDSAIQPLLFRVLNSYLDQGVSTWKFPIDEKGFLATLQLLEKNSFISLFKSKRARNLLLDGDLKIEHLLKLIVGDQKYFEQYLFDQQFSHRGWSGMVATIEQQPHSLLDSRKISLQEVIIFELLLELDALDFRYGENWLPLSNYHSGEPVNLLGDIQKTELQEVLTLWQNAFEWTYYDEVLSGLWLTKNDQSIQGTPKSFQAMFCIDERECSLRRHLEYVDEKAETLGSPGFFGVEFYFKPQNAKFYDKLCPAPVTPKYLIKEFDAKHEREHELLYTKKTTSFGLSTFFSIFLGFWAGIKLSINIFKPKMSPAISNAFTHMEQGSNLTIENKNTEDIENNLQIGFTVEEMAVRVEALVRSIGLIKNFAPIIYVVAHGSSSANNPHHGAHDCGACSGRPGSVNAKVFSYMANHSGVRKLLAEKNIIIPNETQFIGALHDTAADEIEFYLEEFLSENNKILHSKNKTTFEKALDLNAKERSRRFASINSKSNIHEIRKAIKDRSVSLFEPRPELGHGTNTLCVVGRRDLTKKLFLDRRAFLNSYDYTNDLDGTTLLGVLKPLGIVCGGINLEYYFSRVDNHKLGAGTKLPHHVMGLIGVANSCDGDLRPGLPLQMIEVHDPVRLLLIVEHYPETILKTIQKIPEVYEWYINEWVHLISIHPETKKFHVFKNGGFSEYTLVNEKINSVGDLDEIIETTIKMETNYIVDATKENSPTYILK